MLIPDLEGIVIQLGSEKKSSHHAYAAIIRWSRGRAAVICTALDLTVDALWVRSGVGLRFSYYESKSKDFVYSFFLLLGFF